MTEGTVLMLRVDRANDLRWVVGLGGAYRSASPSTGESRTLWAKSN